MFEGQKGKAHHPVHATHALEVVLDQVAETNLLVKVLLPTLDTAINTNRDETLLTNGATEAPSLVASRQMGQSIRQIVKLALVPQLRRHVVLEPESLGDLHLDAHLATDVLEQLVTGRVDLLS